MQCSKNHLLFAVLVVYESKMYVMVMQNISTCLNQSSLPYHPLGATSGRGEGCIMCPVQDAGHPSKLHDWPDNLWQAALHCQLLTSCFVASWSILANWKDWFRAVFVQLCSSCLTMLWLWEVTRQCMVALSLLKSLMDKPLKGWCTWSQCWLL